VSATQLRERCATRLEAGVAAADGRGEAPLDHIQVLSNRVHRKVRRSAIAGGGSAPESPGEAAQECNITPVVAGPMEYYTRTHYSFGSARLMSK
jgi:hypothetical protein